MCSCVSGDGFGLNFLRGWLSGQQRRGVNFEQQKITSGLASGLSDHQITVLRFLRP